MKRLLVVLALLMLCSCMAKTQVAFVFDNDKLSRIEFFDSKTRQGADLQITQNKAGLPDIKYKVEVSDANAVALKALGVADKGLDALAGAAAVIR